MFSDIVKIISLTKKSPYIIFGGTIIVDEPICKKKLDDKSYNFTECIDNWVIKDISEKNEKQISSTG